MPPSDQPPNASGFAPDRLQPRSPWSAYRVALIVIAGLTACVLAHLKITYDKAVRDAETLISALAVASEQHIGGSLDAVDSLLDELAASVREGRHRDPNFTADFAARLPSYPEIRHIAIADGNGRMLPDSWPPHAAAAEDQDATGRRFFTAQRDARGPGRLVVGDPVVSGGERTLHLSRPVRDRAGRFAGVVVAAINPDAYAGFLSSILYDEAGSCGVITLDGRMVARAPGHAAEFGRDISDSDLIRTWAPRRPRGVAHLVAKTDGNDKLLAYRVMPEFGLMVTAGVSRAKAMGGWKRMAAIELLILATFSGMLLYWTRRLHRQNAQLASEQRNLEATVAQRNVELEAARQLAESRALQLGRINEELKRLTLVASHHLQEPLRSMVSCSQMVARSFSPPPQELQRAVAKVCEGGLALKDRLSEFEHRIAALTRSVVDDADKHLPPAAPPAPVAGDGRVFTARAMALTVIAAMLAGNVLQLRGDHGAAIAAAENLTSAVVKSIAHHLQASFRRIDSMLNDVALAAEGGRIADPQFGDRLLARLATVPEVRMVALADAAGRLAPRTWPQHPGPTRDVSIADREYFIEQARSPRHGRLTIGRPRLGAIAGERSIQFSHPILGPGNRFDGVVVASVNPDLYARFLDTVVLDEGGGTAVITLDGHLVARAPKHEEKFALDLSSSDLFTRYLPRAPEGIAHLVSKTDGNDKLLGYRTLSDFPLVVTSGYSTAKALGEWKIIAVLASVLAVSASAVLFAWAHGADRHAAMLRRHRAQLAAEVASRTAGLAAAHDDAEQRSRRLADANDRLHELIRLIAAELRAPLDILAGDIAALHQLAGGRKDEADHWLGFITAGSIHLQALLRDYPRFVTALCEQPALRPVDCSAVAEAALARVRGAWGDDRIEVLLEPLPRVQADAAMLHEVFIQLLTNAALHARREQSAIVRLSATRQEIGWRVTVSDNGPGLPPVNGDHLFRAFETAHGRNPDATGLGLPLCRVLIQHHGGRIWATSRPGKGCDIHFTLPAADDAAPEAA